MTEIVAGPGLLVQAVTVMSRDLRREFRSGEVLWVTLPFGGIALLLVPLAVGTSADVLHRIGPGMFWVIVMLFGVLTSVRRANSETDTQKDFIALVGLDPAATFAGRAAASFLLLLMFEVVLGVVAVVLYDITVDGLLVLPLVLVLVAAGLSLLGTLASGIASSGQSATALVPLLVAPMSVPLLLGATQSLEAIRLGRSSLTWVLMMTIVVLLLAVTGVMSARTLQETT